MNFFFWSGFPSYPNSHTPMPCKSPYSYPANPLKFKGPARESENLAIIAQRFDDYVQDTTSQERQVKARYITDVINIISQDEDPKQKPNPIDPEGQQLAIPKGHYYGFDTLGHTDTYSRHQAKNGNHYVVFANVRNTKAEDKFDEVSSCHQQWYVFSEKTGRYYSVTQSPDSATQGEMSVESFDGRLEF